MEVELEIKKFDKEFKKLFDELKCDTFEDNSSLIERQGFYHTFYEKYSGDWINELIIDVKTNYQNGDILDSIISKTKRIQSFLTEKEQDFKKFEDLNIFVKNLHNYADIQFRQIDEFDKRYSPEEIKADDMLNYRYNSLVQEKYEFTDREYLLVNYYKEFQKLFNGYLELYKDYYPDANKLVLSEDILSYSIIDVVYSYIVEELKILENISFADFYRFFNKRKIKDEALKVGITSKNKEKFYYLINFIQCNYLESEDKNWGEYICNHFKISYKNCGSKGYRDKTKGDTQEKWKEYYEGLDDILKLIKNNKRAIN